MLILFIVGVKYIAQSKYAKDALLFSQLLAMNVANSGIESADAGLNSLSVCVCAKEKGEGLK